MLNTADVCVNPDVANEMNDNLDHEQDHGVHGARQADRAVRPDRGPLLGAGGLALRAAQRRASTSAARSSSCSTIPERRAAWASSAAAACEDELEWRHEAPKLLAAYDALLARRRRRRGPPDERGSARSPGGRGRADAAREGHRRAAVVSRHELGDRRSSSLATFVVLVRYVGPHEVGLLAAAMIVLNFAALFVEQGFVSAIVQRREITPAQLGAAFVVNIALAALVFAALAVGAPWIARAMRVEALAPILPWAALVVPLNALGFCQLAMAQRHFAYKALAWRTLLAQAVAAVVAIALAVHGAGVWALVAQALLNAGLRSALLWLGPQWRLQRPLDFAGVRSMAGYSVNILGTRIVDYGNQNAAPLLIAASVGPTGLGLYMVGVRIYQTLLGLFTSAVMQVAHSGFSRLADNHVRLAEAHRRAIACTAPVALPAFTLTAIAAPGLASGHSARHGCRACPSCRPWRCSARCSR